MRERGLKHVCGVKIEVETESLPVRERGLKHMIRVAVFSRHFVAPRAGAWIETFDRALLRLLI